MPARYLLGIFFWGMRDRDDPPYDNRPLCLSAPQYEYDVGSTPDADGYDGDIDDNAGMGRDKACLVSTEYGYGYGLWA